MAVLAIPICLTLAFAFGCARDADRQEVGPETRRLAVEARRVALTLADPVRRARLQHALRFTHSLPLPQAFHTSQALLALVPSAIHWHRWNEDPDMPILVAVGTSGIPLAFDLNGGPHRLDPSRPPVTPVLVLRPLNELPCSDSWLCGVSAE